MTQTPNITRWQVWMMAARPKTLPAAVGPVLVGTAAAIEAGRFRPLPALAALAVALLLQIGVNMANDYFDFMKGIDTTERLGPTRVAASGLISPARLRLGMAVVFGTSILLGGYLMYAGGWPVIVIGLAAILAALAYSGGPFPIASHGLGDLFVFIFFGLVAVCGTYYVQARSLTWLAVASAVPPGLLITAILVVNNLRDIETDARTGKRTLAVILGADGSRIEFYSLLGLAYLAPCILIALGWISFWGLLPFASIPMAIPLIRVMREKVAGRALNKSLADTARLSLVYSLLFAVGLILQL